MKSSSTVRKSSVFSKSDAVMVAHYYTDPEPAAGGKTGGCISDSLEMARFGAKHPASTLPGCGGAFGGNGKNRVALKNHPDANAERGVFTGSRLSD